MTTKNYSPIKDAMIPCQKILSVPYNVALADLWKGHMNTIEALNALDTHSVIWDLTEIKKVYSIINFYVLYQDSFACEISYRDGFEKDIEDSRYTHEYHEISRKSLLLLLLMLCDDVLFEDYNADIIKTEGDSTCITTNNYTLKMQNPANGMPGTRIEFKASDKFELIIFAYKS